MSIVNTTSAVYVYINGVDVSRYLIEGSLSDESAYTSSIITTSGSIILGGSANILDVDQRTYPIGGKVQIYVKLTDGRVSIHPKGTLFIINSSVDVENKTLTLDVGCSLAFIAGREESYTKAVSDLFDRMISQDSKSLFIIDKKDLSTLSSILDVEGSVIYQDPYGNIQRLRAFGSDGLGSAIVPAKVTSFDKYTAISIESISDTAIEDQISSITVDATVEVPKGFGNEEEKEPKPPTPEPFISSVLQRTIDRPTFYVSEAHYGAGSDAGSTGGYATILQGSSSESSAEAVPNCGTPQEPEATSNSEDPGYYIWGDAKTGSIPQKEEVITGRYVEYKGPGLQVSREESWEYCSAYTWGATAINNSFSGLVNQISFLKSECSSLLGKANQYFSSRNQQSNPNKYIWYNCMAMSYFDKAKTYARAMSTTISFGVSLTNRFNNVYGVSNLSQTFNTYGKGGELTKQVTKRWTHGASWEGEVAGLATIYIGGGGSSNFDTGPSKIKSTSVPNGKINNPSGLGLKLASESVKTYKYDILYTTETEQYIDYQNPNNSYLKETYSASGSSNPSSPDRLIDQTTAGGDKFCKIETEQLSLSVKLDLSAKIISTSGWFGAANTYDKKVSLPAQLSPILPILNTLKNTCGKVNVSGSTLKYENLMKRYASILAKKNSGDNKGFRVTEKLRANLFEYYPFYPVNISLESIGKAFTSRAAASSWVFDSENCLCSLDCMVSGSLAVPNFADPSTKPVYIRTEIYKPIAIASLGLSATTDKIRLGSTPSDGDFYVDGIKLGVNSVVSVSDIELGKLIFVPNKTGQAEITVNAIQLTGDNVENGSVNTSETVSLRTVVELSQLNPPATAVTLRLASLPTNGTVILDGVAVDLTTSIPVSSVSSRLLEFEPNTTGSFSIQLDYKSYDLNDQEISSTENIFPPIAATIVTEDNYFADGGDVQSGQSDGGLNTDAGDFDTPLSGGGPAPMEGGDFDIGGVVTLPPPVLPSNIPSGNNSVDPEEYFGVNVESLDGSLIGTNSLATVAGEVVPVFDIVVNVEINPYTDILLVTTIGDNIGWDYGTFIRSFATSIDMGTIYDSNDYNLDFGTFENSIEPVLISAVV